MNRITDRDAILTKARAVAPPGSDVDALPTNDDVLYLSGDAGLMAFTPEGHGVYRLDVIGTADVEGKAVKAMFNGSFEWMFLNTDCVLIYGNIPATLKEMRAMIGHVPGAKREDADGGQTVRATLSIAAWAKSLGIVEAIKKLEGAGQNDKAMRLAVAWRAQKGPVT